MGARFPPISLERLLLGTRLRTFSGHVTTLEWIRPPRPGRGAAIGFLPCARGACPNSPAAVTAPREGERGFSPNRIF